MSSPSDAPLGTGPDDPSTYENLDFSDSDFTSNDFLNQECSVYGDMRGKQIYRYDGGIIQLPVADDKVDGTVESELVQVYSPVGQRVIQFTTEREGLPPRIPDPFQDINDNETLLTAVVVFNWPVPLSAGLGYAYGVQGEYTYASTKPWVPTGPGGSQFPDGGLQPDGPNAFPMGLMPMMKSQVNNTGNPTGVTAFRSKNFTNNPPIVETDNDDEQSVCADVDTPPDEPTTGSDVPGAATPEDNPQGGSELYGSSIP